MALFDFIKRLFGEPVPRCPHCRASLPLRWNICRNCGFTKKPDSPPSSTAGRDYNAAGGYTEGVEIVSPEPPNYVMAEVVGDSSPESKLITGLDATKFAPISTAEALSQSQSVDWQSTFFDRRGQIPPADLPRIQVIDQTMVGLGLISAEELAEIHHIGAAFEEHRTDQATIALAGARAVTQARAERAALRERKREEAAERKRARAEAIAHRRATDIIFLGRDVSAGLHDRRSMVEQLATHELPVLSTPADLAGAIGISISQLRWLAFHSIATTRTHYFQFSVPKKSGGTRQLASPHKKLAASQRWVLEEILRKLEPHPCAHGFVMNRSTVTNAAVHEAADIVINCDLSEFFPTITFWRVEGLFRSLGYSPAVATILALLSTECPRETVRLKGTEYHVATGPRSLPQGACTSPGISNLVARHLDLRLSGMAQQLGWCYTRYADDITFSKKLGAADAALLPTSDADADVAADRRKASGSAQRRLSSDTKAGLNAAVGYVLSRIRHIADDEGFAINESKTRVLRGHTRQTVTGIVVNDRLGVDRKTFRRLRAILHNAKSKGLESQNRDQVDDFPAYLNGMISYVEMVNRKQGAELRSAFNSLTN